MAQVLLSGGMVLYKNSFQPMDIFLSDGVIASVAPSASGATIGFSGHTIRCDRFFISPAFVDVHVHLREPGFSYKATIGSETAAAAAGGYTTVCAMPNVLPPPDCLEHLLIQQKRIEETAKIQVFPYGCITRGSHGNELSDMDLLAPLVCAFSDDGKGVQKEELMRQAMKKAAALGKPICAHCEVESLLSGGAIHQGRYAQTHHMAGISSESEWRMIQRDLHLVEETGCRYHVCHISCLESVELIREAKRRGLPVTCETAPHYLCLCEDDLQAEGRFKMNPPLRSREDKQALVGGFCDGTIDFLATDHAPHSSEEKGRGLEKSLFGVVGLETAFSSVHTALVSDGKMSLESLMQRISVGPRRFLGLPDEIRPGVPADLVIFDPEAEYMIDSQKFLSAGRATPLDGMRCKGRVEYTIYHGQIVWKRNKEPMGFAADKQ